MSIHKSSAINQLLNNRYNSKDRIFRVRNDNKINFNFESEPQIDSSAIIRETHIFLTIAKLKNESISSVAFGVNNIFHQNKSCAYLKFDVLNDCRLEGTVPK